MNSKHINSKVSDTIRIYQWIISTIVSCGKVSFKELSDLWEKERLADGYPLSRTTFNRYRDGIMDLYGLEILCKSEGRNVHKYYIRNKVDLYDDSPLRWSINSMALNSLLYKHDSIRSHISIDQNFDTEHLNDIMEAIEKSNVLRVTQWDDCSKKTNIVLLEPYGLVLRQGIWFLVTVLHEEAAAANIIVFNEESQPSYEYYILSNFLKVENTGKKFIKNKYFKIQRAVSMSRVWPSVKSKETISVTLMVNEIGLLKIKNQNRFLYNINRQNNNKSQVTLFFISDEDVIEYILSLGANVKVVAPQRMVDTISQRITEMYNEYCE